MGASAIENFKRTDRTRPNLPGEHWLTLGTALAVWLGTRRHPSLVVRVLGSVAGTALVARAATGRQVPPTLKRWLEFDKNGK